MDFIDRTHDHLRVETSPTVARQALLTVRGELDRDTLPVLGEAFAGCFDPSAVDEVVLDLCSLTFVDAAGMRLLLRLHHAARDAGAELVIHDPAPLVSRVLGLVGLVPHLRITRPPAGAATGRSTRPARPALRPAARPG